MMERALQNYIDELKSDIASLVYSEEQGTSFEDKFTEYCIEIFESIGKTEGAKVLSYIHPNSQGGVDWKINGYCLKDRFKDGHKKEYYTTLDLFVTFCKNTYDYNITKEDYTKTLNQIKKFIKGALKSHIDYIDSSHTELIQLLQIIGQQGKDFDRINIYFLINGFSDHEKEKIEIDGIDIFVHTWDLERLFRLKASDCTHEPIEIDFQTFTPEIEGLQCLQVPNIDQMYDCYLAIIPGEVLAKLYKEYSNELLESNVRAFLGQAGKFNKGIRDTIRFKPQMFLPYNNGITATAEKVETKIIDNRIFITKLNDFQIVNGGQTTASLYHTQKKFKEVDLTKIFVQMKLTVIKDKEQKNIEVPNISRFANSQNKVSELDLSSNNPYFIQVESLSRKKYVINPENKNQSLLWFFERTNGQYREILNKLTPSQQRKFKEQNPSYLKFVKSDIAKFLNIWDMEPHFVATGSQKNFVHYIKKINNSVAKNGLLGDNFYKKLIANAILFKTTDKLFGRKNIDAIGDTNLKSFTVAYTLSYFHFLTHNRINLWQIYEQQKIDNVLSNQLKKLLIFVYNHFVEEAKNSLISEYAKRNSSWEKLKQTIYPEDIEKTLETYLISEEEKVKRENEKEIDTNNAEDTIFLISEIQKLGIRFWDGFRNYLKEHQSEKFDYILVSDIFKKIKNSKNLSIKEIAFGEGILEYLNGNKLFIEEMKSFSDLEEKESLEVKAIYDRLRLFTKDDWKQIIDQAIQTNLFSNLELANVKSVRLALLKKRVMKEQAIIKAYESIQRLKSIEK